MKNQWTANEWKHVLHRISLSKDCNKELDLLSEYLEDCETARTNLLNAGYGHAGMKLSEIASIVAPF